MSESQERLIVTPGAERPGTFTARLESTGEEIVGSTRQPLVDGARALLELGFDPATPLTMRAEGKAYDSFQPMPIGQWAKVTYTEGERTALKSLPWRPVPAAAWGQKLGSDDVAGTDPHPEANSLVRSDRDPLAPMLAQEGLPAP